jgi:hypothetical protein
MSYPLALLGVDERMLWGVVAVLAAIMLGRVLK